METENKLPKEFKEKWVAALRSGEYKQAKYYLSLPRDSGSGFAYCCLGVACRVAGYSYEDLGGNFIRDDFKLVPEVLRGSGKHNRIAKTLTLLNDREEKTFPEIADWIDENL